MATKKVRLAQSSSDGHAVVVPDTGNALTKYITALVMGLIGAAISYAKTRWPEVAGPALKVLEIMAYTAAGGALTSPFDRHGLVIDNGQVYQLARPNHTGTGLGMLLLGFMLFAASAFSWPSGHAADTLPVKRAMCWESHESPVYAKETALRGVRHNTGWA